MQDGNDQQTSSPLKISSEDAQIVNVIMNSTITPPVSSTKSKDNDATKKRTKGTQAANVQHTKERLPFPRFGEKLDQRAVLPKEEIESRIDERKTVLYTLLQQERLKRDKDSSFAEFIPEMNAVKVLQLKGKVTGNIGFSVRRENLSSRLDQYPAIYVEGLDLKLISRTENEKAFKFLHIEEALYLIDIGILVLIHEKEPIEIKTMEIESKTYTVRVGNVVSTVQEAYSLFLRYSNLSNSLFKFPEDLLNSFIAYSYLKKLGFTVQRHSIDHIVKDEQDSKKRKVENEPVKQKQKTQSKRIRKEKVNEFPNTYPWAAEHQPNELLQISNSPLVYNLKLDESQELNLQQLFNTLNIVRHETFQSSVNSEKERIMFDVWKSGITDLKSPPSMVVIITSFSRSTVPSIEEVFSMHNMFGNIPIFYCIVGDSGSVLFMNIAPFEVDNLNAPPLSIQMNTSINLQQDSSPLATSQTASIEN